MSQEVIQKKYYAFISYRHADNTQQGREWASWLHQSIETYDVPIELVGKKNARGDVIPERIFPIFRDEEELPADADLGKSIVKALDDSRMLIVLCSPNAVASTYVADEIDYFKKQGHSDRIIAAMIEGEPNASWDDGKKNAGFLPTDECFPEPLQFEYDREGKRTQKRAEPIAADFRIFENNKAQQGWADCSAYEQYLGQTTTLTSKEIKQKSEVYHQQQHLMLLKIIAGILGIPLGDLTKRDKEYQLELERQKTKTLRKWLSAVAGLAILAIVGGVFAWMQTEKATEQQEIAEEQTEIAEEERDAALMNESIFLMNQAKQANDAGASDLAILLALNALPGVYGGDRPLLDDFTELRRALSGNRKAMVFQHSGSEGEMLDKMIGRMETSPDGSILATANTTSVVLWSLQNGEKIHELSFEKLSLWAGFPDLAFSRNGHYIAMLQSNGTDGKIFVWDVKTGDKKFTFDGVATKLLIDRQDRVLTKSNDGKTVWRSITSGETTALSISDSKASVLQRFNLSSDGKILLTAVFGGNNINIWSTESGEKINEIDITGFGYNNYLSPKGDFILGMSQNAVLWSAKTGEVIGNYTTESASGMLPVFSPDGKKLILPISFSKALMISTGTGEILYTIDGGAVYLGGHFSPRSDLIFTTTSDGYLINNADTGETISSLNSTVEIGGDIIFAKNNEYLIYSDVNGAATLWPLNQQSLDTSNVEDLIAISIDNLPIGRTCLTPEERKEYSLVDLTDEQWIARGCPQFTNEIRQ